MFFFIIYLFLLLNVQNNYVYLIRFCIYNLKDNNYLLKKTYQVLTKYIWYEMKNNINR